MYYLTLVSMFYLMWLERMYTCPLRSSELLQRGYLLTVLQWIPLKLRTKDEVQWFKEGKLTNEVIPNSGQLDTVFQVLWFQKQIITENNTTCTMYILTAVHTYTCTCYTHTSCRRTSRLHVSIRGFSTTAFRLPVKIQNC